MNSSNIELCNRCKIKEVEFFCKDCSPFNRYCSNCDTFIHSLPSKREHHRELIHQNYNEIYMNVNRTTGVFWYTTLGGGSCQGDALTGHKRSGFLQGCTLSDFSGTGHSQDENLNTD